MKKHLVSLLIVGAISNAYCATTSPRRTQNTTQMGGGTTHSVSARSATSARSAKPAATTPPVTARSATTARAVQRASKPNAAPTVSARAGATQKVVGNGTKVTVAESNTVVDATCTQKFNGCMDTFCINENISGGRCQCSAQNAELAKQLAEIEELDAQSYKLATVGVETIETGVNIAAIQNATKRGRTSIDLSQWNQDATSTTSDTDDTKEKTGVALQNEAAEICLKQMPECATSATMLRTLYAQQIKSDCTAYQNAIKQQYSAAKNRLAEAQRALRSSAYEKLQEANKYDLGGCTLEYKKCMMTTGGCGEDFKGCVGIVAAENARLPGATQSSAKTYDVVGSSTKISIAASSYDVLESKRPLCESILNSCQNVKDQVWASFLREAAPQIKTAELLAESDLRTSCMDNISACFVKACKDNIDPSDPDGSYDMCLTRPETVKSLCKVQIEPCEAAEPLILDYVYARLAAMRVDSCTTEVRQCLQSDDRCGEDYTACVGLDTDTIIRMCPYDKLVGCQKVYGDTDIRGDAVYDELATMVQGIMLGIDNNLLEFCQNAANESMIRVCGDTENCNALAADDHIGAGSLNYGICYYRIENNNASIDYSQCLQNSSQIRDVDLGRVPGSTTGELGPVVPFVAVIDGIMFWELVTVDDEGNLTGPDEYFKLSGSTQMPGPTQELVKQQLSQLQNSVNMSVQSIESDPTVQFCMTGRKVQGMKDLPIGNKQDARFPQLTKQMKNIIATSALSVAKNNYYKKYDELYERQMKDYVEIAERQAEIKGENAKDVRREAARQSCVSLADMASLPMSPPPPGGWGMWLAAAIVTAVGVAVTAVTFGSAGAPVGAGLAALWTGISSSAYSLTTLGVVAAVGVGMTGLGAAMVVGSTIAEATANHSSGSNSMAVQRDLAGHHEMNQWNWKQVIDTTFEWDTLKCTKCVKSTKCSSQSYPLFGKPKCKKWEESTTTCTDTQF